MRRSRWLLCESGSIIVIESSMTTTHYHHEKKMRKASWNRLNCESLHNYCMCLFVALWHAFSLSFALMFCSLWLFHFPTAVVLCILLLLLMPLTMKNDAVVWSIRAMEKMRKREQAEDVWWKVLGRGRTGGWWEDDDELYSRMNMSELYWKIQRLSFSVVFWMLKTVVKIYDMISFSALLLSNLSNGGENEKRKQRKCTTAAAAVKLFSVILNDFHIWHTA